MALLTDVSRKAFTTSTGWWISSLVSGAASVQEKHGHLFAEPMGEDGNMPSNIDDIDNID